MPYLILILMTVSVMAQDVDPRKDKSHPCFMDFPLHCQNEVPGNHNLWRCLGNRYSMLSEKCEKFMIGVYKNTYCGMDVIKYCPKNKRNFNKWFECLDTRKELLSKKCLNWMKTQQ